MRRIIGLAGLALAGCFVALVAVEIGLRATAITEHIPVVSVGIWKWMRYDAVLGFANIPGYQESRLGIAIDSLGFRGPEIAPRKRQGTVRIVCIGDSTTFGIWVEQPGQVHADAPYPAGVERLARADGLPIEVVNAGVLGQTTATALTQLLVQVLPLEPDVVVVRLGNNDHGRDAIANQSAVPRWEYPLMRAMPAVAWRSETVRLAWYGSRRASLWTRRWAAPVRVSPGDFELNLHRFVTIAREEHFHLAFADFPYREIERGPSPGEIFPNAFQGVASLEELHAVHDAYQATVARVAAETGTPLVHTRDALRSAPEPTFSAYDLSHPNAAGYRILARRVYDDLRALGWLEPRAAP